MVKNATGGNKSKGQARKFITAKSSSLLRISTDPCEIYAQVTKTLGNGMCHVLCIDGKTRLCHIRGKFTGKRGRRENTIMNGSWILIGLREWELGKSDSKKLENCDLLEVYNDQDKDRLKSTVLTVNWNCFISNDNKTTVVDEDSIFEFSNEKTEEYRQIIESQVAENKTGKNLIISSDGEEIDVDDI